MAFRKTSTACAMAASSLDRAATTGAPVSSASAMTIVDHTSVRLATLFVQIVSRTHYTYNPRGDSCVFFCMSSSETLCMVVHVGDGLLHAAVAQSAWLEAHAWAMGAGILVLAGLYQFTPLKYACLDKCRSPLSFITEHWRGNQERTQAFRLGMRHGLFCIGCCWSLMLLMFAVGVGNLGWMLVLGALMAIEKNLPWGRRVSAPLGVVLLCWGLALGLEAVLA
jgi:predicted metal-binding membrane protein